MLDKWKLELKEEARRYRELYSASVISFKFEEKNGIPLSLLKESGVQFQGDDRFEVLVARKFKNPETGLVEDFDLDRAGVTHISYKMLGKSYDRKRYSYSHVLGFSRRDFKRPSLRTLIGWKLLLPEFYSLMKVRELFLKEYADKIWERACGWIDFYQSSNKTPENLLEELVDFDRMIFSKLGESFSKDVPEISEKIYEVQEVHEVSEDDVRNGFVAKLLNERKIPGMSSRRLSEVQ